MKVEVDGVVYNTDKVTVTLEDGRIIEIDPDSTTIYADENDTEPKFHDTETLFSYE